MSDFDMEMKEGPAREWEISEARQAELLALAEIEYKENNDADESIDLLASKYNLDDEEKYFFSWQLCDFWDNDYFKDETKDKAEWGG